MAYQGTTSTSPNSLALTVQGIAWSSSNVTGGKAKIQPRSWIYASTHVSSDIGGVNFFGTDPRNMGIQVGDVLTHYAATAVFTHMALNVGATTSLFSTGAAYASS